MAIPETHTIDGFNITIHYGATYYRPNPHQAHADDVLHGTVISIDQVPGHADPFTEPTIGECWDIVWRPDMPVRICGVEDGDVGQAVEMVLNTGRAWRTHSQTLRARRAKMVDALTRAGAAIRDAGSGTPSRRAAYGRLDQLITLVLREGLLTDKAIIDAVGEPSVGQYAIDCLRDPAQEVSRPWLALDDVEFAARLGVNLTSFRGYVSKGTVPEPDVTLGSGRGWRLDTVERWIAARPRRGARTDLGDRPAG